MKISDIMKKRAAFSFEVFPPKTDIGAEKLMGRGGVLEKLYGMRPDYISCTYGAGGSNADKNLEVLDAVRTLDGVIPVSHFTCVGNTRAEMRKRLGQYLEHGVDHILALRGDLPLGMTGTGGDLHYAAELVRFIRDEFGDAFTVAVAGSPEGHIDCLSPEADIAFLKQKQDAGADFIMTQLCWDTEQFARWMDAVRAAGVTMPVDAGIMPVLDIKGVVNMALSRNGCALPRELCRLISKHWIFDNPFAPTESEESAAAKRAAFREAGTGYTVRLIDRYRAYGVDGIHLYTMNRYEDVTRIVRETGIGNA
ncbi:MAG: methylenetetrahydrofolate reductase [Clostridiales Family XIII bacterium]|jgi:methylenetetrahydrofolate reductase (NADPH)|nr:methylenetetrahydrofolate reductase [Clostridiales Family XIII bacterium]